MARKPFIPTAPTIKEVAVIGVIVSATLGTVAPVFSQDQGAARYDGIVVLQSIGMATLMYSNDWDDVAPLCVRKTRTGNWRPSSFVRVPHDWQATDAATHQVVFPNSVFPYQDRNTPSRLATPMVSNVNQWSSTATNPDKPMEDVSFVMNGLLNEYPLSAIFEPAYLPIIWSGVGATRVVGYSLANPYLDCQSNLPHCIFDPQASPYTGGAAWSWPDGIRGTINERGATFFNSGGGARYEQYGPYGASDPIMSVHQPFSRYNSAGVPTDMWFMQIGNHARYPSFFRPDSRFDYFPDGISSRSNNSMSSVPATPIGSRSRRATSDRATAD